MRARTAFLAAFTLVLPATGVSPAGSCDLAHPAARATLHYVERSTGLDEPTWEGGDSELEFADVDGDGNPDIVSIGDHGNPEIQSTERGIMTWYGDGAGSWRYVHAGYLGYGGCALGDVDGDGTLDIAYGMHHAYGDGDLGNQLQEVALGDGTGLSWTPRDDGLADEGQSWGMFATDLGDVDGDGDLDGRDDLAYCDTAGDPRVWLARGRGEWEDASAGLPSLGGCRYTALEDLDADGTVDLVTFGSRWVHVFRRTGTGGAWEEATAFQVPDDPGRAHAFRTGADVDHNGRMDMVTLAEARPSPWTGENHLRAWVEATPPAELRVRLLHPGPHRRLLAGQVRFVRWITEVPGGETARVRLELSTAGPAGPWDVIADDLPDDGRWQWLVPNRVSADCRIRVTVTTPSGSASTVGDGSFEIARRPDPLALRFLDKETLSWDDALSRDRWNLYRGDWDRFLATGELTQEPGTKVPLAEGALGQDSAARMRENAHPCPSTAAR